MSMTVATPSTAMSNGTVALLKRSDGDLFRIHVGSDWPHAAEHLGEGHCFCVQPLLVAPDAPAGTAERIAKCLERGALGKDWYASTFAVATRTFVAALAGAAPEPTATLDATAQTFRQATMLEMPIRATPDVAVAPISPASGDGPEDAADRPVGSDDELWQHVEVCHGSEASKAVEIRFALEASLGKKHAKSVLGSTRATVARNSVGHKTRILKSGVHALRLKW